MKNRRKSKMLEKQFLDSALTNWGLLVSFIKTGRADRGKRTLSNSTSMRWIRFLKVSVYNDHIAMFRALGKTGRKRFTMPCDYATSEENIKEPSCSKALVPFLWPQLRQASRAFFSACGCSSPEAGPSA